jgi:hypothetical protein
VTGGGKEPLKDPDRELVEEPIRQWLAAEASRDAAGNPTANRLNPEAQFLYKSWLDAAKSSGTELISAAVEQYLQDQHNLASWDSNYVFAAWFSHSGQPERLLPSSSGGCQRMKPTKNSTSYCDATLRLVSLTLMWQSRLKPGC